MALLFADGFEDGTTAWTMSAGDSLGTGRFGSGLVASNTTGYAQTGYPPTAAPMICGFAFKPGGSAAQGICAMGGSGQVNAQLARGAGGELIAYSNGQNNTLVGTTAGGVVPAGAWSYIELKWNCADAPSGIMVARVNGVEVLNLTGLDTRTGFAATGSGISLGYITSGWGTGIAGTAFDDVYICDATGSYNNDFLGELTVEHFRPASDDTAQWVGSDSNSVNNWDLVDESGVAVTADYVQSSTVGQRDLYVPAASARAGGSAVFGVVAVVVAQKTDVGVRNLKLCVKEGSGGTVRQSAELGLPTSFGELRAVFDRKADNSQFTIADVNALRVGYEVST